MPLDRVVLTLTVSVTHNEESSESASSLRRERTTTPFTVVYMPLVTAVERLEKFLTVCSAWASNAFPAGVAWKAR